MAVTSKAKPDPMVVELIAIKRLLIFSLMRTGANQEQVAAALGVNQSSISRMFPTGSRTPAKPGRGRTK